MPPPGGLRPPALWGTEERLRELLGDGIGALHVTRRSFVFRFRSPEHYVEFMQANYGPTLKAFEALDPALQGQLAHDITELVRRFNRADDGSAVFSGDYLEVVATKR